MGINLFKYSSFTAVDFETANFCRDSACAIALVRVESGSITAETVRLIKPPTRRFVFTHIHGIRWQDVCLEPSFAEVWTDLEYMLLGIDFLAAHNAAFDKLVLDSCCKGAAIPTPMIPFFCSMIMAKRQFKLSSYSLPSVCQHLGIALEHHDPLSDARACASIILELMKVRN